MAGTMKMPPTRKKKAKAKTAAKKRKTRKA